MSLNINFAATFLPERTYLSKLIMFFKKNESRASFVKTYSSENTWSEIYIKISDLTGIPNGKSTGKVIPHINYLVGMGLLSKSDDWYKLTPFGNVMVKEDISFDEPITMFVAHAMLCDQKEGSSIYAKVFERLSHLGDVSRNSLIDVLAVNNRVLGPIVGTYTDDAAFARLRILREQNDRLLINKVDFNNKEWLPAFGALVIHLLNSYFNEKVQVSIDDFEAKTCFSSRLGCLFSEIWTLFESLASSGYIKVSALVNPPVIESVLDEEVAWNKLYDNLV